jgi:hypothetical protein
MRQRTANGALGPPCREVFHFRGFRKQAAAKEVVMEQVLNLVYEDEEELRCVFNAVVIRNSALNAKYPGGLRAYIEKHGGICNRAITADSFMGGEIDEVVEDLLAQGFEHRKDFICVDAGGHAIAAGVRGERLFKPRPVDLGVEWLEASYYKGGIVVRHVAGVGR